MDKIILVGASLEIIELVELLDYEITGIIDRPGTKNCLGYEVLGSDEIAPELAKQHPGLCVAITIDRPHIRRRIAASYAALDYRFPSLVHPAASVSRRADVERGVIVQRGATISPEAVLREFSKVNFHAVIAHESTLGRFSIAAPGVCVNGRVTVGDECYLGACSVLYPGIRIGDGAVVGMGSVVLRDVREETTVLGNPAKPLPIAQPH